MLVKRTDRIRLSYGVLSCANGHLSALLADVMSFFKDRKRDHVKGATAMLTVTVPVAGMPCAVMVSGVLSPSFSMSLKMHVKGETDPCTKSLGLQIVAVGQLFRFFHVAMAFAFSRGGNSGERTTDVGTPSIVT